MLSLSSQYALKALIYLVQQGEDAMLSGSAIAKKTKIPPKYLSAILSELVRGGLLEATRGKGGGFRLARSPQDINLYEAVEPFEPSFNVRNCPFGNNVCGDGNPCLAHDEWSKVISTQRHFLLNTSIYQAAVEVPQSVRRARKNLKK